LLLLLGRKKGEEGMDIHIHLLKEEGEKGKVYLCVR
jgi:hypothetical protein